MANRFDVTRSVAHDNVHKILPIIRLSLEELAVLPERQFKNAEEFTAFFKDKDIETLLLDVTERKHFRYQEKEKRDAMHSGKKKDYTMKNTVICDMAKYVWFLGQTTQGSVHDFTLLQLEFDTREEWFKFLNILVDLGYLGMDKVYEIKNLYIPIKRKPRPKGEPKSELTYTQKQYNKAIGQVRVLVEHAIGGIKRFNILVYRFRNKILNFDDLVMEVATGIWNAHLKFG